ncbi:glycoside hydrolase family 99-like domain-containing protein [Candidatus Latescibacterota bacterium]
MIRQVLRFAFLSNMVLVAIIATKGYSHAQKSPDVPKLVLAFYYNWYQNPDISGRWAHWNECDFRERDPGRTDGRGYHDDLGAFHTPVLGPYDSQDPEVARLHVEWGRKTGIDVFIATWWKRETKKFENILNAAAEGGMQVSLYYEIIPDKDPDEAVTDLLWALDNYGSTPGFFRLGGKPVIFIYGRAMNQISMDDWKGVIKRVKARHDVVLIADSTNRDVIENFDGAHTYNVVGTIKRGVDMQAFYKKFKTACSEAGVISSATVIPGFDNSRVRKNYLYVDRREGELYNELWSYALESDPDWMIITSFNEWHEGSEIEPSKELGDRYLKRTAAWISKFKDTE